jgi:hypothetical protein
MLGAQNANAMWGLVIAIPAVGLGVLAVLLWLGARERRTTESELTALRSMSSTEAEQQALLLLARHEMFQTHPATQQINHPDLPSHVNALLNRYDEIVRGEFWIGTAALTQPARLPGSSRSERTSSLPRFSFDPAIRRSTFLMGKDHRHHQPWRRKRRSGTRYSSLPACN